ncbi:MAG: TIGR04255 family protein [Nitrospirae bacterium]|nr:TIGR04255 family protein [Nitrospirota bacterium]
MTEYTVFPNAPITEALLDIRAELASEVNIERLDSFHELIKERFPEKKQRISTAVGFRLSSEGTTITLPSSGGPDGFFFRSPRENKIVQARLDGFTFNKLKPYEDWNKFSSEARSLWDFYLKQFNPKKIIRIALRYINRIEVPLPIKDFSEYILTNPEVAPKLSQSVSHFFMQIALPNPGIQASAMITQTMEPPTENQILPLIFDIDVFKEKIYIDNKEEIWGDFENLHVFKNEIFFNSITDKTKELFK